MEKKFIKCEYCNRTITHRKDEKNIKSFKLNDKYICWDCLCDLAHSLGISVRKLMNVDNSEK